MAAMKGPARDFDDYLAAVAEPARTTLEKVRKMIRAAAPEATETISYRLPTFKYKGKPLVALGASKDHCAFYLMSYVPPGLEAELEKYDTGKGTIRFPADKPLPAPLVQKLVKARIAQVQGGSEYGRARS
ncbi:MAG TPA: DUF1801 domain-containing protein [Actinomycetota bacterium]|nr:DUF1801 domain-containing protein [Actinomycetota bacterium]